MKISHGRKKVIHFSDLDIGEVFRYPTDRDTPVLMKVAYQGDCSICVLSTGIIEAIPSRNPEVIRIDGEFIIHSESLSSEDEFLG